MDNPILKEAVDFMEIQFTHAYRELPLPDDVKKETIIQKICHYSFYSGAYAEGSRTKRNIKKMSFILAAATVLNLLAMALQLIR